MTAKKKLLFRSVTALITLVFLELALQALCWLSPDVDALLSFRPPAQTDARPHWMPSLTHPEHDAKGFRNPSVPATVPIVALGDSNTYGWGVKSEEAWPRQLERIAHQKVYSLAWGGFGPVHLLGLLDEALALKPRLVILALYSGNDFYDSYSFVYKENQFALLLRNRDPRVISQLDAIDNDPTQKRRIEEIQASVRDFHVITRGTKGADGPAQREQPSAIRRFVSEHVKLWGLARAARRAWHRQPRSTVPYDYLNYEPAWEVITEQAKKNPDIYWVFDNGRLRTVFTLNYRLYGVDLNDPRIREGHRIAMETVRLMAEKTGAAGGKLLVMRWPTKELAFKDLVYKATTDAPEGYRRLIENEEAMWGQTDDFLTRTNIDHFDILTAIREALSLDNQLYGISSDSHMTRRGQRVIAEATLEHLTSMRFLVPLQER